MHFRCKFMQNNVFVSINVLLLKTKSDSLIATTFFKVDILTLFNDNLNNTKIKNYIILKKWWQSGNLNFKQIWAGNTESVV